MPSEVAETDIPRRMNIHEVAEYLGVAPKTLRNWKTTGRGPRAVHYGAHSVGYLPEDVYSWVLNQRVGQSLKQEQQGE